MEATFVINSSEMKDAIIREIKEKMGVDLLPANTSLFVKFDDVTKSVTNATLTWKKD